MEVAWIANSPNASHWFYQIPVLTSPAEQLNSTNSDDTKIFFVPQKSIKRIQVATLGYRSVS